MNHDLWWLSCVLFLFSAIFAAVSAFFRYKGQKHDVYGGHTEARVVDIVTEPRGGEFSLSQFGNRQAAVLEYFAGGKLYKVTDGTDAYPCPFHMNQRLSICYNTKNPKEYVIVYRDTWRRFGTLCACGAIFFVLAGCAVFFAYASGAA